MVAPYSHQAVDIDKGIGKLLVASVHVFALAAFVVETDHPLAFNQVDQPVLVWVRRGRHRFRNPPDDQLDTVPSSETLRKRVIRSAFMLASVSTRHRKSTRRAGQPLADLEGRSEDPTPARVTIRSFIGHSVGARYPLPKPDGRATAYAASMHGTRPDPGP